MLRASADFGFPDFTGSTILLVDDHRDSLDFLGEILRFCGATVLAAWSTAHARRHLRIFAPRLIVCDFQMPRETGVEFMRWVRTQADERATIPAIAVTGYARDFLRQRDVAFAFDAYFEKPVDVPRVLAMAEVLLLKPRRRGELKRA
jgi:two-component system, OmpR family, response regulator